MSREVATAMLRSFEVAADRAGDIAPAVYEAYFRRCPESSELMRLADPYMRGRMLDSVLELLMADDVDAQAAYLRFETTNHSSYGVLPHMYENLLCAVRDTVRSACAEAWTAEMASAWNARLADLLREIRSVLAPGA